MNKKIPSFFGPFCLSMEHSAGVILFRIHPTHNRREYLLIQYPHGHWEFARGHLEEGETEQEAAVREVEEETGIANIALKEGFRETFSFWYIARGSERKERIKEKKGIAIHKEVAFFVAEVGMVDVQLSDEHYHFLWMPFEDAVKKLTYNNAQKVLTAAEKFLN